MTKDLIIKAQNILLENYQKSGYTIPCKGLYPFQWFWDSGFIALGYAYFDIEKAKNEITSLLNAQWQNGFIPHIIFHQKSKSYFPGPEFYKTELSKYSLKNSKSSGLTQPPVLGFILEKMLAITENKKEMMTFIKSIINKVYFNHQYLYKNRDPNNEGLAYIYHNWESGTDNSPVWDEVWNNLKVPKYEFERRDTTHVNALQRPTNEEYNYYLHLVEIAKKYNYSDKKIAENSPFLIQDPLFNAILIKSNESLINLYEIIGNNDDKIKQLKMWQSKSIKSFNSKLFDEGLGVYVHYDIRNSKQIQLVTSSSFAPLFAKIPSKKRASSMVNMLGNRFSNNNFLCASFDPTHEKFNPVKYWRGPVWINLNWMLFYGLKNYNFNDLANQIKYDSIFLIKEAGFYEYFDPRKSKDIQFDNVGCGGSNFSWSASLFLDFINN